MNRTYLYGIVEHAGPTALDVPGVDGTSRARVIACGGLGAVVSGHRGAADFRALPRERLLHCLLAHQRVVERVVVRHVVLPVRFGTVLEDDGEVRGLVSQNQGTLSRALASMRGMAEMEVAATWEIGRILQEIGREPSVMSARERIERSGHPSTEDRAEVGRFVKSRMDARREAVQARAIDLLGSLAAQVATHPLLDDRMVMNAAFLVASEAMSAFDRRVRELDALFDGQIAFRVVGPLPPYTFATVNATRMSGRQLEEARQVLGLNGEALNERVVRRAYRRLAARAQRQLPGDDPGAEARLSQLRSAWELLLDACHSDVTGTAFGSDPGDRWLVRTRTAGLDAVSPATFGGGV